MTVTPAHDQSVDNKYIVHYPAHYPRQQDPQYPLFEAYRKQTVATAKCYIGERVGFQYCTGGLELHHAHLEFSTVNGALWQAVAKDYPSVTDENALQAWAESEPNFRWLCQYHHRGHAGAHVASHADWEAGQYVPGLLSMVKK